MRLNIGITLLLALPILLNAQLSSEEIQDQFQITIKKTNEKIKIDGLLDEAVWNSVSATGDFYQKYPNLSEGANPKTEVRLCYNDQFLFISAVCYETKDVIVKSLKRDKDYFDGDGFGIIIDPLNTKASGFFFGVNTEGVQTEGVEQSSNFDLNLNWDNKWYAETNITQEAYTVEIAIPFKTLRFDPSQKIWGINFIRNAINKNEYHSWTPIPEQYRGVDLGFTGKLIWETAPPKANGNISLIPYVSIGRTNTDFNYNAGLDAKVALNSALNLDLTLNPDFSQVEIDEQQTNLTRFNIFLPEKRTFFLENDDLFSSFGIPGIKPFQSRTIGLNAAGEAIPILYGARLTGNLTERLRTGVMNVQTLATGDEDAENFSAVSIYQTLFKRSRLKAMFNNRQSITDGKFNDTAYGRNLSTEFTYVSDDNKWQSWVGWSESFKKDIKGQTGSYSTGMFYSGNKWNVLSMFNGVGKNYYTDMGFAFRVLNYNADTDEIIRESFHQNYTAVDYFIYGAPEDKISLHRSGIEFFYFADEGVKFVERFNRLRHFMSFNNTSELRFRIDNTDTFLKYPFKIVSDVDAPSIPVGRYNTFNFNIEYVSDGRKALTYELGFWNGGFYNGTNFITNLAINYRAQPWGNFGVKFERNQISLPDPYGAEILNVLTGRMEVSFSRNLHWTTFLQYTDQYDNFNVNSRIQWRFAPMSDVYLVYTDNYEVLSNTGSGRLQNRNRAIVLKVSYWWSI